MASTMDTPTNFSVEKLQKPSLSQRHSSMTALKHRRTQSSAAAAEKSLSGRPGTCTLQQLSILNEFRRRIAAEHILEEHDSLGTDDATLLRFLRARQFKLDKSLAMIKATKAWRASVGGGKGMDDLYERQIDPFAYPERETVSKYWPLFFHHTDKRGNPINVQRLGSIDLKGLYREVEPDRHWEIFNTCCEMLPRECMPACAQIAKREIEGAYCIVDLAGFSVMQFWHFKSAVQKCFQISQDHYPETVVAIKVVNAPSGFSTIWRAIKPWLAPETARKVDVLGGEKEFGPVLRADIDANLLPDFLGGTCTCEGKGGCMFSSVGPWQTVREECGVEWARKGRFRNGQVDELGSAPPVDASSPGAAEVADVETRPLAARRTTSNLNSDIARHASQKEEAELAAVERQASTQHSEHKQASWTSTLNKSVRGLLGKPSSDSLKSNGKRKASTDSRLAASDGASTPPTSVATSTDSASVQQPPKPDPAQGATIKVINEQGDVERRLASSPPASTAPPVSAAA